MGFKVWENRPKTLAHLWLWRRLSADDISAKMDLTLQKVIDGEISYVDAACLSSWRRRGDISQNRPCDEGGWLNIPTLQGVRYSDSIATDSVSGLDVRSSPPVSMVPI